MPDLNGVIPDEFTVTVKFEPASLIMLGAIVVCAIAIYKKA